MKNILIIKIGQKIIFNRKDKLVKRDNSNGNYELYQIIKLLCENNSHHNFFIGSDNDLLSTKNKPKNLYDISESTVKTYNSILVVAGLEEYEKSEKVFNLINDEELSQNIILLSTDPRCLKSTLLDSRLKRKPNHILSQFEGEVKYNDIIYNVEYIPLETASAYQHKKLNTSQLFNNKTEKLVVLANSSAKEYGRIKKVADLLSNFKDISVYGKIVEDEIELLKNQKYKGNLIYDDIPKILEASLFTLIVPIDKNMVTAKYIEALMYNCIPIFYEDYNTTLLKQYHPNLIEIIDFLTIKNASELYNFIKIINTDAIYFLTYLYKMLYEELVEHYLDGSRLSQEIMRRVL